MTIHGVRAMLEEIQRNKIKILLRWEEKFMEILLHHIYGGSYETLQ